MEAAASPLPSEDTTPPVTKMYFGATSIPPFARGRPCSNIVDFRRPVDDAPIQPCVAQCGERGGHRRAARDAEADHLVAAEYRLDPAALGQPPLDPLACGANRTDLCHQRLRTRSPLLAGG